MKKIILFFVMLSFATAFTFAQDENQDEMMKAWQESMTPGPMHELLGHSVGEWDAEVSWWMDPSQPPSTSEAHTVCESMMGGRYFKSTHTGMMMGMPFEGFEVTGYDNVKKKFFNVWFDNMGTGMMTSEGSYDEASKSFTFNGVMTDPMGNDSNVREVINVIDNDHHKFEMYVAQGDQEMKMMEINYTRTK